MNGKLNLFIRVFVCFFAYFYSLNAFALTFPAKTQFGSSLESEQLKCSTEGVKRYPPPNTGITSKIDKVDAYSYACSVSQNGSVFGTLYSFSMTCGFSGSPDASAILKDGLCTSLIPDPTPPPPIVCDPPLVMSPELDAQGKPTGKSTCQLPQKDCAPLKGRLINAAANDQGQICAAKCRANPVKIVQQCAPGQQLCLGTWAGQYRYDGTKCNGSEISVPAGDMTDDPEQLNEGLKEKLTPFECFKKGLSSGTVNGKTICIPNNGQGDTKSKETSTETKTNPDGSTTTTTTTTTKTDSGGKISTETETKTETKNSAGESTGIASGVSKVEEDKDSYCKKNPNSESCKVGTASGGCDKAFTCEGDAISCEATKVGWLDFCATEKSRASEAAALADFESSKFVLDGNKLLADDGKEASAVSNALGMDGSNSFDFKDLIDTDGFLSGGVLSDQSFTVYGKSFSIPFSKMNYWLKLLGDFAVMITFMICIRIVLGGFK